MCNRQKFAYIPRLTYLFSLHHKKGAKLNCLKSWKLFTFVSATWNFPNIFYRAGCPHAWGIQHRLLDHCIIIKFPLIKRQQALKKRLRSKLFHNLSSRRKSWKVVESRQKKENLNFSHSLPKISTFKGFLVHCKLKIGDLIKTVFIIN